MEPTSQQVWQEVSIRIAKILNALDVALPQLQMLTEMLINAQKSGHAKAENKDGLLILSQAIDTLHRLQKECHEASEPKPTLPASPTPQSALGFQDSCVVEVAESVQGRPTVH